MKKLITILGLISVATAMGSSSVLSAPITNVKDSNVKNASNNKGLIKQTYSSEDVSRQDITDWIYSPKDVYVDSIDLDDLSNKLKKTDVNLYQVDLEDEKAVVEFVIKKIIFNNKSVAKELTQVMKNYMSNEDDWVVLIPQIPGENSTSEGTLDMLYLGESEQFTGTLSADVKLLNENEVIKPNISTVLENTDLGVVVNLDSVALKDQIIELNPKLTHDDFEIIRHYDYLVVNANEEGKYEGTIKVSIVFNALKDGAFETLVVRADAYNSTQDDDDSASMIIPATLGKDEFLKKYSTLEFFYAGKSWNNGNNPPNDMNKKHTISILENSSKNLYKHNYDGAVNWMHSQGNMKVEWSKDEENNDILVISMTVKVEVYASAWNAMWARAEASGRMEKMNII
ncbi:hypothetical protein [Spiroplasma endosymbiont of Othius punctulatus]|uniref:hypothetical protein n=1 Tax=Spiroplasma endosymbiont of Othius punctulatus TaxID=3066289 RepID=UPI0030D3BEC8